MRCSFLTLKAVIHSECVRKASSLQSFWTFFLFELYWVQGPLPTPRHPCPYNILLIPDFV